MHSLPRGAIFVEYDAPGKTYDTFNIYASTICSFCVKDVFWNEYRYRVVEVGRDLKTFNPFFLVIITNE